MIGGDSILYIVGYEKYKAYMKTGIYKYVPEFLMPTFKPRIIDNISIGEKVIGQIVGINLKKIDFSNEKVIDEYISGIIKVKSKSYEDNLLYIEEKDNMDIDVLRAIEDATAMKIPTGKALRKRNLSALITEYFNKLGEDVYNQELLLICDNKEESIYIIRNLSRLIKYITLIGPGEDCKEEIYMDILDSTGLSIFQPDSIEKRIKSYNIIINLSEKTDIKIDVVKRKALIIDFSDTKPLKNMKNNRISDIIIEDICFRTDSLGINPNAFLNKKICSGILEGFGWEKEEKIYQIYAGKEHFFIKDYIKSHVKTIGRI